MAEKVGKLVTVADVVRKGEALQLPEKMKIDDAIKLLQMRKMYEEEDVAIVEVFNAYPYDGACAFDSVLTEVYGFVPAVATETFFGKEPPALLSVEIGYEVYRQVPWGKLIVPGISGSFKTGAQRKEGRWLFQVTATVKRKDEGTVKALFAKVREYISKFSIYRAQAVKIRFHDDDGDLLPMPVPKFMDLSKVDVNGLVYSDSVMDAVNTNLLTPISRPQDCLDNGIPVKRGVLLGGTYGTGKTLAALVAAKLAVNAGVTYVYIPRARELSYAIEFAKFYQNPACAVFCEDIDREMTGDERTVEMDDILNTIDGIDSKTSNVIVVLTTNHLERINTAMLRPGRLDAVIEVTPPDAKAVERLVRLYAGPTIAKETDLTYVGETLAGQIPAVIAEVVRRAKLWQLSLQAPGTKVRQISPEALIDSARSMEMQLNLLKPKGEKTVPTLDEAFRHTVSNVVKIVTKEELEERFG